MLTVSLIVKYPFFMAFLCSVVGEKNDCYSWSNIYNYFCFLIFNCLADVDERIDLIRNNRSERLDQYVMAFKGDLQFITARQDHIYLWVQSGRK